MTKQQCPISFRRVIWLASPARGHGPSQPAQQHAIKLLWEANRERAAALGTALHAQIETHLLTSELPDEDMMTLELKQYLRDGVPLERLWAVARGEEAYQDFVQSFGGGAAPAGGAGGPEGPNLRRRLARKK